MLLTFPSCCGVDVGVRAGRMPRIAATGVEPRPSSPDLGGPQEGHDGHRRPLLPLAAGEEMSESRVGGW